MPRLFFTRTQRRFFTLSVLFMAGSAGFSKLYNNKITIKPVRTPGIYETLNLASLGLDERVFDRALKGWNHLISNCSVTRPSLLSIADLSQSSAMKRLYVIDMEKKQVLFNTFVAHGRNSGDEFATAFGNKPESFRSSLGFYLTGNPYKGEHGLSLRLKGLEQGINDKAEQRGIVMHGADYVSEEFISRYGRLGRSQGCPAVPASLSPAIIDLIKDGSCLFMYYPDSNYLQRSFFFN
jgi:hypothetical protein